MVQIHQFICLATIACWISWERVGVLGAHDSGHQKLVGHEEDRERYREACPAYKTYASVSHPPLSKGPLGLPFQRPSTKCRTFASSAVEQVIQDITSQMKDLDLARIFENAFPNTLDTTISWHRPGGSNTKKHVWTRPEELEWEGTQSFVVTGDINAEWLRDSTNQLQGYQALATKDAKLQRLILGAINTQVEYVIKSPYCNAFQPPPPSGLAPTGNGMADNVHPAYEQSAVFECKYELDSLGHFLRLGNEYFKHTGKTDFLTERWFVALATLMQVLEEQSQGTFNETSGKYMGNIYTFQRNTNTGTETLSLKGVGNPIRGGTGLIRSAFRPSDDATILPFFIPANAMMAVELKRAAAMLKQAGKDEVAKALLERGTSIEQGIAEHAVVKHKSFGDVYAFEVDGFGSHILMDDANLPSLLSLPLLGFVDASDPVYQNTRRMILSKQGNPYFLKGSAMKGIGGPHVGLQHSWPMSLLVQAMTSDDDAEILDCLLAVRNSSKLGLVHESVHVDLINDYTRSWFAWANSVFAQTILDVAERKPYLLFGKGAQPYKISDVKLE